MYTIDCDSTDADEPVGIDLLTPAPADVVEGEDADLPSPPPHSRTPSHRYKGHIPQGLKAKLTTLAAHLPTGPDSTTLKLQLVDGIHVLDTLIRFLDGSKTRFLELVQLGAMNDDPSCGRFLYIMGGLLPHEQKKVSLDAVCQAAGVTPAELLSAIVYHGVQMGHDLGEIIAASLHPKIVKAAADSAQRTLPPPGTPPEAADTLLRVALEDRKLLFQHHRFIPVPKNTQITVNATAQAGAAAQSGPSQGLPSFLSAVHTADQAKNGVQQAIIDAETLDNSTTDELAAPPLALPPAPQEK